MQLEACVLQLQSGVAKSRAVFSRGSGAAGELGGQLVAWRKKKGNTGVGGFFVGEVPT